MQYPVDFSTLELMDQNPSKLLPSSSETQKPLVTGELQANPPENPLTPHIRSKRVLDASIHSNLATVKETLGLLSSAKETEVKPAEAEVNLTDALNKVSQLTFELGEGDDLIIKTHQDFSASAPILQELQRGILGHKQKISGYESQLASLEEERGTWQAKKIEYDSKGFIARTRNSKTGKDIEERLRQIESQITELQSEQSKLQAEVERAETTLKTVGSLEREAATRMVDKVTTELRQKYDAFQEALFADPALKRKLNETFLEEEFMPRFKRLQKEKNIPQEVVDEYLRLSWQQLEDGTAIYGNYPPEKKDRITATRARMHEIGRLPEYGYELGQLQYRLGVNDASSDPPPNNGYDQILELLLRNEQYNILHGLSAEIQNISLSPDLKDDLLALIDKKIDTKEPQHKKSYYDTDTPVKIGILDISKIEEGTLYSFFLQPATLQRWETIKTWEGTTQLFGTEGFTRMEKTVQDKSISDLLITPDHTDRAIIIGYRILKFKNAEAAPFVITNCWRESGYSGEMPFLDYRTDGGTLAYKYIASLPDVELAKLEKMNIPGMMDVIRLVREHPEGFLSVWVENPRWETFVNAYAKKYRIGKEKVEDQIRESQHDERLRKKVLKVAESLNIKFEELEAEGDHIDNPVRIEVEKGLVKMSLHLMSESDERKQFFVMHLLEKLPDADLGQEGYRMLGNILKGAQDPKLQEALLETVMRRYDDINAALAVMKSYPSLAKELQEQVKGKGPELLSRFIKEKVSLETSDIEGLASLLETNHEDLKLTIDFVREIDSLSKERWRSSYDHEHFADFVKLAKQPEILPLIKELIPFGYEFSIQHAKALQDILVNKGRIFADIQELKSSFPDYTYNLDYIFKYDESKKDSEQIFITDPYELKVRQLLQKSQWVMKDFFSHFFQLQTPDGTLSRRYSDSLLRELRWNDPRVKKENCEHIDDSSYHPFFEAFQSILSETMNPTGRFRNYKDFFQNSSLLYFLARNPDSASVIFSFAKPDCMVVFRNEEMKTTLDLIFQQGDLLLKDKPDAEFLSKFVTTFNYDTDYFLHLYIEGLTKGTISADNRDQFIENYRTFSQTHTPFSTERLNRFRSVTESPFGIAIADLIQEETVRNQIIFDYACYTERLEANKVNLINKKIPEGGSSSDIALMFEYIRWLPDAEVSPEDNLTALAQKYQRSHDRLKISFQRIFPRAGDLLKYPDNIGRLNKKLDEICSRFRIKSRKLNVDNFSVTLPEGFIREFNALRHTDPSVHLVPELASYVVEQVSRLGSAYTTEDLMYSQIGETEDTTGRRRGQYSGEKLLQEMESNIEASLNTWSTAIDYQHEEPDSPLFIIANERTGPADLAAEYLPGDFAQRFGIAQKVDCDKFFPWFRENESFVEALYNRYLAGENVRNQIPEEVLSYLDLKNHSFIPIYRLKVPSSLNAATEEPEGIDTVLNFLKLSKILGGRVLFMDESTRSAPRSIECLYNVIQRRRWVGTRIRFFGKINGATGQNGTKLEESNPLEKGLDEVRMEIGFIDPWKSPTKSITDDSAGFVPEVQGKGIVEIVRPSNTSISPFGIGTIQDFWKQMIANEVTLRFDAFKASGGTKKTKEEYRTISKVEVAKTQEELKKEAFSSPYKALLIDLDGTIGSRGEYNPKIIEKIKELTENGTDVIIATARSLTHQEEYDGSVQSFLDQLGQLTEKQKIHIHLGTEGGAVLTSLNKPDNPEYTTLIPENNFNSIESAITSISSGFKTYRENATVVVRGFDTAEKESAIERIREEVERLGLPFQVSSDTRHSIHIRPKGIDKRKILNWLESKTGIGLNDIAKIGDSPEGNDRLVMIGRGAFNVGKSRNGTIWTIHMDEHEGGPAETEFLLQRLTFI